MTCSGFPTGKIEPDSLFGMTIGFTSDRFNDFSYLWGDVGLKSFCAMELISPVRFASGHNVSELGISKPPQSFCYVKGGAINE